MNIKFRKTHLSLSKSSLEKVQSLLSDHGQNDYLNFLAKYHGAIPETNTFYIPSLETDSGINEFFSEVRVIEEYNRMVTRIGYDFIPVADAEGGNLVCLKKGVNPGVYFWDHEQEKEEDLNSASFFICNTFDEFLSTIDIFDINTVELKPGQAKVTWSDPDFEPEFD